MRIRIYQINSKRDKNNMLYMSHNLLEKFQGSEDVDSSIYDKIYEGTVFCKSLEEVFGKFNRNRPSDFKGHNLSISDIVEVVEDDTVKPGFYFCDSVGFKNVPFEADKTQTSERLNKQYPTIEVLLVEPLKKPERIRFEDNLEVIRELVGGNIETISSDRDNTVIVLNRDATEPYNRAIYSELEQIDMPYNELKAKFREAERSGKSITGYIVFTADSFKTPYSEFERTYAVSSNNKAFIDGMGGYSIYASSLDGVDKCIRLESLMAAEQGGRNGWKIERCYVEDDRNRKMVDIIKGKFFICYVPSGSENFKTLPETLIKKYYERFKSPEKFVTVDGNLTPVSITTKGKNHSR